VLQCVAVWHGATTYKEKQVVAVCCSALQYIAVCCLGLQCCGAITHIKWLQVCRSVLQCATVCCSVLQCIAVCCSVVPVYI